MWLITSLVFQRVCFLNAVAFNVGRCQKLHMQQKFKRCFHFLKVCVLNRSARQPLRAHKAAVWVDFNAVPWTITFLKKLLSLSLFMHFQIKLQHAGGLLGKWLLIISSECTEAKAASQEDLYDFWFREGYTVEIRPWHAVNVTQHNTMSREHCSGWKNKCIIGDTKL